MLAEISRIPLPDEASEDALMEQLVEAGGSISNQLNQVLTALNTFQELMGSASYPASPCHRWLSTGD